MWVDGRIVMTTVETLFIATLHFTAKAPILQSDGYNLPWKIAYVVKGNATRRFSTRTVLSYNLPYKG